MQGWSCAIEGDQIELGQVAPNAKISVPTKIRNFTSTPISIVGQSVTCKCLTTEALPLTIPPYQTREVAVVINTPGDASEIAEQFKFFMACDGALTELVLPITGRVGSPAPTE